MRVFWADFSKLRRPLTLWITIVMMAAGVLFAANSQSGANSQLQFAKINVRDAQSAVNSIKSGQVKKDPNNPMMTDLEMAQSNLENAKQWYPQVQKDSVFAASTQRPLGALGMAIGTVCSLVGAFALVIMASGHVAGEWTGLTIKEALIADRRRGMTIFAKLVSLFVFGVWLVVCSWVAIMIWGLISRHIYTLVANVASTSAVSEWVLPMTWRAPLAVLFFVTLAVFLAVLIRNNIGTLLAGAAIIVGVNIIGAAFRTVARFTPASWLADWMDFKYRSNFSDHLWVGKLADSVDEAGKVVAKVPHWSGSMNVLALGTLTVVLIGAAMFVMRRRDAMS